MKKISTVYERLEQLCTAKNIAGIPELAKELGYKHPEKLYRLGRQKNAKPSFDILVDLSNLFEDLNLRWFINGKGNMLNDAQHAISTSNMVNEPNLEYVTTLQNTVTDKNKIIIMLEAEVTRLNTELKKKSK